MDKDAKNATLRGMYADLNAFIDEDSDIAKISSVVGNCLATVSTKYKQMCKDVARGQASYPTYKSYPFYVKKREVHFRNGYNFTTYGMKFNLHFGRDRSNNKSIVDKCISGEYSVCDSSITRDDRGKLYLLMVYKFPKIATKLDKNKIMGVDLGIAVPIFATISDDERYSLKVGDFDSTFRRRLRVQKQRRDLQRSLDITKGGKGRKKKLKALDRYSKKESNMNQNINHNLSRVLIKECVKHGVGTLVMEDLSGFGGKGKEVLLRNWTYFDLQSKIECKAKEYGIDFIKVNPRYTSQRCSSCGVIDKENRKSQAVYECGCGHKENADRNATKNIISLYKGEWNNSKK